MILNFDLIAPVYDFLAKLIYGHSIREAQSCYLHHIKSFSSVLILGGGTGWILDELSSINNDISVDYVEASSKMLTISKNRGIHSFTSLNFILGTELVVQNNTYDFILTPFVLDVFPSDELGQMVNRVKKLLSNDGVWCCVDFNSRDRSFKARVLSFSMILFFRMVSGLKTTKVLDYFGSIKYAGMIEVNSTFFYGKFIRASLFKRK
jgi:tRNA (cmo5U34)-methyltransferase